jgi:hypothetical protein
VATQVLRAGVWKSRLGASEFLDFAVNREREFHRIEIGGFKAVTASALTNHEAGQGRLTASDADRGPILFAGAS